MERAVFEQTLNTLNLLLLDLPKDQLAKNAALWGARSILQFSLDQFQKEWEESFNAHDDSDPYSNS